MCPKATSVPLRSRVVQFPEDFLQRIAELFPERAALRDLFEHSRRGVLFSDAASDRCRPDHGGPDRRPGDRSAQACSEPPGHHRRRCGRREALTSDTYLPDPSGFMTAGINKALAYINDNLTEDFSEADLAGSPA